MKTHQTPTGKVTQVKLPSAIEQVLWTRRMAAPGATVGLEIFTHFVGNGSEIRIELIDHQGRKHGSFKEKIAGNRFWAAIQVPAKAEKALVATVKLPKHGLEMTSPALLLTPSVAIENLAWSQEEAHRGDVLTLTADVKGAPNGTEAEITIFEHDADGAHELVTKVPTLVEGEKVEAEWEFEYHEDTDDIPAGEELESGYRRPEYFFRVSTGGVEVDSQLLPFQDVVEIELVDDDGLPMPDERFEMILADGSRHADRLDAGGRLTLQDVPPGPYRIVYSDVVPSPEAKVIEEPEPEDMIAPDEGEFFTDEQL